MRVESTEAINRLSADLEASNRSLQATIDKFEKELSTANTEVDIALSKLKDLEQQLEESAEIGRTKEAMIEKLEEDLSTANAEVNSIVLLTSVF